MNLSLADLFIGFDGVESVRAILFPENVAKSSGISNIAGNIADPMHWVQEHGLLGEGEVRESRGRYGKVSWLGS